MFKTIFLLFLEILPVLVFFVVGQYTSFRDATMVYVVLTAFTLLVLWLMAKRISYLSLILGVVVIGAGSLSVWFNNPNILLLTDTFYYLGSALVLLLLKMRGINLYYILFHHTFGMNQRGWDILVSRWIIALVIVGIVNELVRQFGTIPDWFVFQLLKTFVLLGFASYQFTLTKKYRLATGTNSWGVQI